MSRKKLTATNLEQGTGRQNHFWKTVNFCPKCYAHGNRPHYNNCDGEFVRISQDAQIPKRNSSKKIWDRFIRKFVDKEFLKKYYDETNASKFYDKNGRKKFIKRILNKKQ